MTIAVDVRRLSFVGAVMAFWHTNVFIISLCGGAVATN